MTDCPFVTPGLKAAALGVIARLSSNKHLLASHESNKNSQGPEDEHATLLRVEHFAQTRLGTASEAQSPDVVPKSLLSYLYGDVVATQEDSTLALRKLALSYRPGPLRVATTFCFFLGAGSLHRIAAQRLQEHPV